MLTPVFSFVRRLSVSQRDAGEDFQEPQSAVCFPRGRFTPCCSCVSELPTSLSEGQGGWVQQAWKQCPQDKMPSVSCYCFSNQLSLGKTFKCIVRPSSGKPLQELKFLEIFALKKLHTSQRILDTASGTAEFVPENAENVLRVCLAFPFPSHQLQILIFGSLNPQCIIKGLSGTR